MKLIVQIPCYNEAENIADVIAAIPRDIAGVDEVVVMIIDDGSTDDTVSVARDAGADIIHRNRRNLGLARTFRAGIDRALREGADIIVNTDGDGQYPGRFIPALIEPIVKHEADITIGDRQTHKVAQFSPLKKLLQRYGSALVARLSDLDVPDAVSGFRAFSRDAAFDLNIVSSFSYTIESLIQAGRKQYAVTSVPIEVNEVTRPSRLFRSIHQFLARSGSTMFRMYAMYKPLRLYAYIGTVLMLLGAVPVVRFIIYYLLGDGSGKIQSLIVGTVLLILGGLAILFGMLADLISFNRQLSEMTLERVRRIEIALEAHETPVHPDDKS
ncbi:MAG: glycosyltransferase family 2 protein [Pseudomonadota bacterium]